MSLSLLALIGGFGCSSLPDPAYKKGSATFEKNPKLSERYSSSAWRDINDYLATKKYTFLVEAAESFNNAWQYNTDNYEVYWGWGVITGIKAEDRLFVWERIRGLKVSRELLEKAVNCSQEPDEQLLLDLANAMTMLGASYISNGESQLAEENLNASRVILDKIAIQTTPSPRVWGLLAYNAFYRCDYELSRKYVNEAEVKYAPVEKGFVAELNKKMEIKK